ncbi:MAG: hypothetical protein V1866_05160 [archaeon]
MEGIEIVITRKLIERVLFSTVILILLVLLIIQWSSNGSCEVAKNDTKITTTTGAAANQTAAPAATPATTPANQSLGACSNGAKDINETDVDCGGSCPGCAEYRNCNLDKDCGAGLYCFQHIKCMKPTCEDGIKNQDETNVDCGGACAATKGAYFWSSDAKCHTATEPSGKLEVKLTADVTSSTLSGNAVLNSLTINLVNGLPKTQLLNAYIYAFTSAGKSVFADYEGNDVAIDIVMLNSIAPGGKLTKTVSFLNNTRRTLSGVKSTNEYELRIEFKDAENVLVERAAWTNS